MNPCPLCGQRRARRACPGVRQTICAVCCGTKREREIACPSDCVYLSSAREHPPAVVQRRQEQDYRFYRRLAENLSAPQEDLLLLFAALTVRSADAAVLTLRDEDVAEAARVAAGTLETAAKGILYSHPAETLPAQRLADEYSRTLNEMSQGKVLPASAQRDAAVALRRLHQGAGEAGAALDTGAPPIFIPFLRRLLAWLKELDSRTGASAEPAAPRIIIP
jgi:hypothetical protein